jgi:hypothetical protein
MASCRADQKLSAWYFGVTGWREVYATERPDHRLPVVLFIPAGEVLRLEPLFTARQVVDVLGYLFAVRGTPEHIRSDSGPEFVAQSVRRWLDRLCVKTLFVAKASQW